MGANPSFNLEAALFLVIQIPDLEPASPLYPPGNLVAPCLLARVLDAALAAEGLNLELCEGGGEFNRSIYALQVHDLHRAARVIVGELKELKLEGFATLAAFDFREEFWRTLHPHAGGAIDPALLQEFAVAPQITLREHMAALKAALKKRGGQSE